MANIELNIQPKPKYNIGDDVVNEVIELIPVEQPTCSSYTLPPQRRHKFYTGKITYRRFNQERFRWEYKWDCQDKPDLSRTEWVSEAFVPASELYKSLMEQVNA